MLRNSPCWREASWTDGEMADLKPLARSLRLPQPDRVPLALSIPGRV